MDTLFSTLFFRRVRATSMNQRRVENTHVHFWTFSPVSVKYRHTIFYPNQNSSTTLNSPNIYINHPAPTFLSNSNAINNAGLTDSILIIYFINNKNIFISFKIFHMNQLPGSRKFDAHWVFSGIKSDLLEVLEVLKFSKENKDVI